MMNSKMITTFSAIMLLSGMIAETNVAAYDDYILPGSECLIRCQVPLNSGIIKLKNGNKHGLWSLVPLVPV